MKTWPLSFTERLIACTYCDRGPGQRCVTASGDERAEHAVRFDAYLRARRTRPMRMELLVDDDRFGLLAGDVLVCVDYPYDAKVTVLYREADGHQPECNQYNHHVRLIEFAEAVPAR
jgi:hypothetical protein